MTRTVENTVKTLEDVPNEVKFTDKEYLKQSAGWTDPHIHEMVDTEYSPEVLISEHIQNIGDTETLGRTLIQAAVETASRSMLPGMICDNIMNSAPEVEGYIKCGELLEEEMMLEHVSEYYENEVWDVLERELGSIYSQSYKQDPDIEAVKSNIIGLVQKFQDELLHEVSNLAALACVEVLDGEDFFLNPELIYCQKNDLGYCPHH